MGELQDPLLRPQATQIPHSQAQLNEMHARTPTQSTIHCQPLTRTPSFGSSRPSFHKS